jgi:ribosomal subunit interface protein
MFFGCEEDVMTLQRVDRNITVQSSNVALGEALPQYARECILKIAGKYFGRLNTASVHFTREGITYRCSVNIQMGALKMMSAEAQEKDIRLAFTSALDKVAKQLRRYKREQREDKGVRVDKDVVVREGMRVSPAAGSGRSSRDTGKQPDSDASEGSPPGK